MKKHIIKYLVYIRTKCFGVAETLEEARAMCVDMARKNNATFEVINIYSNKRYRLNGCKLQVARG